MKASSRMFRNSMAKYLSRAAAGEEVIVTKRGHPYVRLLPASISPHPPTAYPLRGTLVQMTEDFDASMPELWEALRP